MIEKNSRLEELLFGERPLIAVVKQRKSGRPKGSKNRKDLNDIEELAKEYLYNKQPEVFQELWMRSVWGLKQHARKLLNNEADVDDVIANVFIKICDKSWQFDKSKGKFSTWMYKICYNEALALKNAKQKDRFVDIDFNEMYPSLQKNASNFELVDDFDFSDKFETTPNGDIEMMDKEMIKKRFFDTSLNLIRKFEDKRISNCLLERFNFSNSEKNNKALTLQEIADKYHYPITSVKNWINKGRNDLKEQMMLKYPDLYEMWRETLD